MRRTTTSVGGVEDGYVPNIKGVYDSVLANKINHTPVASGVFSVGTKTGDFTTNGGEFYRNEYPIDFDASRSNSAYINDNLVIPRNLNIGGWLIKYI